MASEAVTTALAVRDETSAVMLTNAQLQMIANTSFVPAAFRGKVPEVLACVATGRALGLPDMTSLRGIHVIEGKATLSAELMVAIVRSHGHSITGTVDEEKAVARGERADNGDTFEVTFTMSMAEKAKLTGKQNWVRHPDDMMWARAVSKLCRRLFADCFAGATYVPEEVELSNDDTIDEAPETFGAGRGSDTKGAADPEEPSDTPPATWAELKERAAEDDIEQDVLADAGTALFPGRNPSSLDAGEVAQLWDEVVERSTAAAAA